MARARQKKTVSLVLGSGGARGLAHIGIIRWLEEHDYEIRAVSGSSVGALIGGVYAAGKLEVFAEWVQGIGRLDILRMMDISLGGGGLVKGDRVMAALRKLIGDCHIEDLPIPYTAVASDIVNEKEVWFNQGKLFDAVRASIAMPLFFTPVNYQGRKLLDGGVLNPVPIAPTLHNNTDLTVAVNLAGHPVLLDEQGESQPGEKYEATDAGVRLTDRIKSLIGKLQHESFNLTMPEWGLYTVADQSIDAMQGAIARQKLAAYPPDVLIDIPRNVCGTLDFDQSERMIALGYEEAAQCPGL